MTLISTTGDPTDPQSWRSSAEYGGSPGVAGLAPINSIVVNEVLTHTDPPLLDAVELYNPTNAPINIGGWYLSDGGQPAGATDGLARTRSSAFPTARSLRRAAIWSSTKTISTPRRRRRAPNFSFNAAHGDDVWLL